MNDTVLENALNVAELGLMVGETIEDVIEAIREVFGDDIAEKVKATL
jgi:UDP-glucose 4-epimerase